MKKISITLTFSLLIITAVYSQHTGLKEVNGLRKFSFTAIEKKLLPGKSQEKAQNGAIEASDIIGNLGLVSLFYQNACYTDGRYNHNDFAVEKGEVSDGRTLKIEAYRIYEPAHKATNFLASQHNIYYQFKIKQDYTVYQFDNDNFRKVIIIIAKDVKTEGFTKIPGLTVSNINGYSTFLIVPSTTDLSVFNKVKPNIEAAKVNQTPIGAIYKFRYTIKGSLFDYEQNLNSTTRHYFSFAMADGKTGLIWQDVDNFSLHLTTFYQSIDKYQTIDLPNGNKGILAAATGNIEGDVFYLTIFEQDKNPVNAMMHKVDSKTGNVIKNKLDVSSSALNMFAYKDETACMNISGDSLLLMIARTMHKSEDGLNHQGGIAVLFDARNLNLLQNYGQTSGHSFDNYLTVNSMGDFVGIDLGDNYPRGINLHRFTSAMSNRLVYTFKTAHGETADCWGIKTFPVYPEISTPAKKYYKWSNDNNTYTELGAVVETDDGFIISYLGEPDKNGKALNNSEVGKICSKNIGFVKVKKTFDDGSEDIIMSKGISEKGGFYTFGGRWSEQKNTGIVWLTKYLNPDLETARSLKTVKLDNETLLFLWELWAGSDYKKTLALKTDKDGKPIGNVVELGNQVRLDRRDDLLVKGNQVIIFSGSKNEQKLELTILDAKY